MKILIVRFSSIGDIILTTPVIRKLKQKYPDGQIDILVLSKFKDAITGNPNIDEVLLFEKENNKGIKGIKAYVKENLKDRNYDLVIDLHSKLRSKLISFFLGKKTYRYKKRKFWKTLLVKLRIIKYIPDDTIVKRYFTALENLDVEYENEELDFNFFEKEVEKVSKYNNYVVFAPGASKETKKWPGEYFAELGKKINNEYGKKILLVGSKAEYEELESIRVGIGEACENLGGKLTLKDTGALMARAFFVLTNDSGPFHIARGVKADTYVIFGPTSPNMFDFKGNSTLIYLGEKCSPCSLHGDAVCPKQHFNCMKNIEAKKVFEIIKNSKK
jgi:lipopolysaccharide heptosyltransferase II